MSLPGNPPMKQLVIGGNETNHLVLNTQLKKTDIKLAKVTIVYEDGTVAKDDQSFELLNKTADMDGPISLDFKFHPDSKPGFYRAFWVCYDEDDNRLALESRNDPEGLQVRVIGSYESEIVTPAFVRNTFLQKIGLGDYKDYAIREQIMAAQSQLEKATQIYFLTKSIIDEKHDYEYESFTTTFWLKRLRHWPIVCVTKWQLKYGNRTVLTFEQGGEFEPEAYLQIDKQMGTIELLPLPSDASGYFYTLLYGGLSELGASVVGTMRRIPHFFHIDYQAGLDFHNMDETDKANIRYAIARRTAINCLPKIDDKMGIAAESTSMDGTNKSVSLTSSAMYGQFSAQIEQYTKEDQEWVKIIRNFYGKNAPIVVA